MNCCFLKDTWLGYERTLPAPESLSNYLDIRGNKSLFQDPESRQVMPDIWSATQPGNARTTGIDELCVTLTSNANVHDFPCVSRFHVMCQLPVKEQMENEPKQQLVNSNILIELSKAKVMLFFMFSADFLFISFLNA